MKISTASQVTTHMLTVCLIQNSTFPLNALVILIGTGSALTYRRSKRAMLIHCKMHEHPDGKELQCE